MRKHGKHRRYTEEDILAEAEEYLKDGVRMQDAADTLNIPLSTLSWHLLHPLKNINYNMWVAVRKRCFMYAKKPEYYMDEIDLIGIGVTHKEAVLDT